MPLVVPRLGQGFIRFVAQVARDLILAGGKDRLAAKVGVCLRHCKLRLPVGNLPAGDGTGINLVGSTILHVPLRPQAKK